MGITVVIGLPRQGKTTYLSYVAKKYMKKGKKVFSNVYIEGANLLDHDLDLNTYKIENGLVVVDEGGTIISNRDFRTISRRVIRWYKLHGHYHTDVIISSQDFDLDLKIRNMTEKILVVKKSYIPFFVLVKQIKTRIDISEDETQIIQRYKWKNPFLGGWKYIFMPPLWKLFNSYYQDKLIEKQWDKWTKENEQAFTVDFTNEDIRRAYK